MNRIKLLVIVIAASGMALFAGSGMAEKGEQKELKRAVIKINTLSCGGCFSTISQGLESLEGFSGMGANLFRKLIAVDYTEPLTRDAISKKLAEVGYPGEIKGVDTIREKESFAYLEAVRGSGFAGGGCCSRKAGVSPNPQLLPKGQGGCCALPQGKPDPERSY